MEEYAFEENGDSENEDDKDEDLSLQIEWNNYKLIGCLRCLK